ncbi:MAG: coiled coil domain-containing protein [Candidatus Methylumidiphilus sp.]
MSNLESYKQKIEAELEVAQAKLAELKAHVKSSAADVQLEYAEQIAQLEQVVDAGKAKLGELAEAGEETWEHLKESAEHAWEKLSAAVKDVAAKL